MSSNNGNHPLPLPPGQQQRPGQQQQEQQRPRAKSSFSFRSHHSNKSSGSGHKIDLHESHEEKQSKRLHTKADPSMAITEAEPSAVARQAKTSLAPIRAIQHRDKEGNAIADPDRSNPTRSRWERPLDTIRAFEAAIDGNYSRKSYTRTESASNAQFNRRSSYYGGTQVTTDERPRYGQNGYYGGGRFQSYRPESAYMGKGNGMPRPDSYYNSADNQGPVDGGPSNGYFPNRARYPRTASEPQFNNSQSVYPVQGNQQSYETVTTASGSGSSADPAGYSTDPSSENSSGDRVVPPQKDLAESYGFNGFGANPQYLPPGSGINDLNGAQQQGNGYQYQGPPPRREVASLPRVPIKLGSSSGNILTKELSNTRAGAGEKRKSWLGRRFSKNA